MLYPAFVCLKRSDFCYGSEGFSTDTIISLSMLPNVKSYILVILSLWPSAYLTRNYTWAPGGHTWSGMDSELKFHNHTDFVVNNNADCILALIFKVFECKDSDIMFKLYKFLVHLLLEYNNVICGSHYVMDKYKVETIQRRATRMIPTCCDLSYCDRLTIWNYHHYSIEGLEIYFLYQMINNLYDINTESFLSFSTITSTRGHNMKLFKPQIELFFS